jgi:hypothetical protein
VREYRNLIVSRNGTKGNRLYFLARIRCENIEVMLYPISMRNCINFNFVSILKYFLSL